MPDSAQTAEMEIDGLSWSFGPIIDTSRLNFLWTELEERSDCSFFLTWDWIGNWLAETPGLSPLLLSVYDGSVVVALAVFQPAVHHRYFGQARELLLHQSGDPSLDIITMEYNGIISDRRYTERIEAALFCFMANNRILRAGEKIHVALATASIADHARRAGLLTTELVRMPSWFVDVRALRASGGHYLESLGSNTRQQITRSLRLYQKRGPVKATVARSAAEALEFLDELKSLHQKTWTSRGSSGSFASRYFERFHRTLIDRCIKRHTVELVRVTAGGHLIGQLYNFIRNGHVYAYQTGLSYEDDAKLKPGLICHTMCIDRHLHHGASVYDFMAGSARYKANLGIRGPDLIHYMIEQKTLRSRSLAFGRHLERWLRKR